MAMCLCVGHLCISLIWAMQETFGISRFLAFYENKGYRVPSGGDFFTAGWDDCDPDRDSKAPSDRFRVKGKEMGSRGVIRSSHEKVKKNVTKGR